MESVSEQPSGSCPQDNNTPLPYLPVATKLPSLTKGAIRRRERKKRRIYTRHPYSDIELREILQMMWKEQDDSGTLSHLPEFVRKYIPSGLVPPEDEAKLLRDRVDINLTRRLNKNGGIGTYHRELCDGDCSKLVMVFSCYGAKPVLSPLLDNLPIIKLQELSDDPTKIDFHNSKPLVLQSGQALSPEKEQHDREDLEEYGTLGFFLYMKIDNDFKHLAATVGHVVGDFGRQANLSTLPGEEKVSMATITGCERYLGKPAFRHQWKLGRPALDEICLLEVPPPSDQILVSCVIKDLDCNKISSICPVSPDIENDSDSAWIPKLDAINFQNWLEINGPLTVHKIGAKTGETTGKLVRIEEIVHGHRQIPIRLRNNTRSSSSPSSSSSSEPDKDETRVFILRVHGLSPEKPFAEPGDSGSLVFAKVEEHIVPLGIHFGSRGIESRAYMLHSWWEEMEERFNADFFFCNPLSCPSSAARVSSMLS